MSTLLALRGRDCTIDADYTIIATDTRATFHKQKNGEKWADDCEKIFLTKFGWVGAFGGIELTKMNFQRLLESSDIKTPHDIYRCFLLASDITDKEITPYLKDNELSESGRPLCTCTTNFTYSLNYFKDNKWHMNLEVLNFEFNRRKLVDNNCLEVFPPKRTNRIKRRIEKYTNRAKDVKTLSEAIYLMACCIQEVSKLSSLINNHVLCGISYKLSDTELIYLKVDEDAKKIKRLYEAEKDLSAIIWLFA